MLRSVAFSLELFNAAFFCCWDELLERSHAEEHMRGAGQAPPSPPHRAPRAPIAPPCSRVRRHRHPLARPPHWSSALYSMAGPSTRREERAATPAGPLRPLRPLPSSRRRRSSPSPPSSLHPHPHPTRGPPTFLPAPATILHPPHKRHHPPLHYPPPHPPPSFPAASCTAVLCCARG